MTVRTRNLDMTMMLTVHDAFRRELDRLTRIAEGAADDPREVLRSALGWKLFKTYLGIHHAAEDEAVWGLMDARLADSPDRAVLAAMEAEHAALDPLLAAVDAAAVGRAGEGGADRLGGLVGELAAVLRDHLRHEEDEGLALIDATLSREEWANFSAVQLRKVGVGLGTYMPWLLDDASQEWVETVLSRLPGYGRTAYEGMWKSAYGRLSLWAPVPDAED
jgi:hemerythrin-like domain-containing protein